MPQSGSTLTNLEACVQINAAVKQHCLATDAAELSFYVTFPTEARGFY